jgi:uncharacterized protein
MNLIDSYIDGLTEDKKDIVIHLRNIIHALVPAVQEKYSFHIPFYHYFGMFCYINPAKNGVDLGICYGKTLASDFASLEVKNRAMVATVRLHTLKDIATKQVEDIIAAAAIAKEIKHAAKQKKQITD